MAEQGFKPGAAGWEARILSLYYPFIYIPLATAQWAELQTLGSDLDLGLDTIEAGLPFV